MDNKLSELGERLAAVEATQKAHDSVLKDFKDWQRAVDSKIDGLKVELNKIGLRIALITGGLAAVGGNLGEIAKLLGIGG